MSKTKPEADPNILAKIAAMPEPFCTLGQRLHDIIVHSAPALLPSLWYGMPAYKKEGKTICFFRADKQYMTFGITQDANLSVEAGTAHQLIESAWYFSGLDDATEARLAAIVRKIAN